MIKVHLHGLLGKKFGSTWELEASSVGEAVHAIDMNTGGRLKSYLSKEGRNKKYKIKINDYFVREEIELRGKISEGKEVHIMPKSMGGKAIARIVVGIVLIIAAVLTYQPQGVWYGISMILGGMGASLVLGGVVELLTPIPKINQGDDSSTRGGYMFQGNAAAQMQGGAVGLAYGEVRISPMPISVSLYNTDEGEYGTYWSSYGGNWNGSLGAGNSDINFNGGGNGGGYYWNPGYYTNLPPINLPPIDIPIGPSIGKGQF